MTLIEVIDTAIKIGFGALITGIASHYLAKNSHERELTKLTITRRLDSLEQVTEKAEAHFSAWRRYSGSLGGIYNGRNPPDPDFSETQWKRIKERDRAFLDSRDGMGLAVARLRLLGLTEAADLVNGYNKAVGEFRDRMILQKETPTHEEFIAARKATNKKIKEFYLAISTAYLASRDNRSG